MKKTKVLSVILAAALMVVPGTTWALEVDIESCDWISSRVDSDPGVDYIAENLIGLLVLLGVDLGTIPSDWYLWDVELVPDGQGGYTEGDGVPDCWQTALLGAVLCRDVGVTDPNVDLSVMDTQYANNVQAWENLVADVETLLTMLVADTYEGDGFPVDLTALVAFNELTTIADAGSGPCDVDGTVDLSGVGTGSFADVDDLDDFAEDTADVLNIVSAMMSQIVPLLNSAGPFIAGGAGISSEMKTQIDGLMVELVDALLDMTGDMQDCGEVAQFLVDQGYLLADDPCIIALQLLDNIEANYLYTPTLPTFEIIDGVAKTANEPMSGFGDWDNDGVTNVEISDIIQSENTCDDPAETDIAARLAIINPCREAWVKGVTEGGYAMPVGGLVGLGLMATALASGAALVLRKRS